MVLTFGVKAAVLVIIGLGFKLFTFQWQNYGANFYYPAGGPSLTAAFKTWDAQHYLFLSKYGYSDHLASGVFYPFFPFLIHLSAFLFGGNELIAGLVLSNAGSILSILFLFKLIQKKNGDQTAFTTCILLLAFPTAFYGGLVYTESLFLLFSVCYFYFWEQKKYFLVFLCAFFLPLTRPTGILVMVPALAGLFLDRQYKMTVPRVRETIPLAGFVLGYLTYFCLMKMLTGNAYYAFEAQKFYHSAFSAELLFRPIDWLTHHFLKTGLILNGVDNSLVNRIVFVLFVLMMLAARKQLNPTFLFFGLAVGLVPALAGDLPSYIRYISVVFPLFYWGALKLEKHLGLYLLICIPLQIFLLLLHSLNYWVA